MFRPGKLSQESHITPTSPTMEPQDYWSVKSSNPTPYYCNICQVYCASAVNLQTHFIGSKHKAVENALKSHGFVKALGASGEPITRLPESLPDCVQTEPVKARGKNLQEQLDSCKDTEPALGLQYITEYVSEESSLYECSLCGCQSGLTNMFMHVLGIKHRLAYLKKHHPEMSDVKGRGSNLNKRLKEVAAKVEQNEGRKQIKVTTDLPIRKEDKFSVQLPDSLVTWFSEDDVGGEKKKENPKPEEKENAKKAEASKDEVKAQCGEKNEEQQDKDTEQQENIAFEESYSDSEEFPSNEEFLKYLQNFEIVDEDDASFILKVYQKLTNSLVMYRHKISEKNNYSEPNPNEGIDDHLEQSEMTSVEGDILYTGMQPAVQQFCEDKQTQLNIKKSFKRKASQLNTNPSEAAKNRKVGTFMSTFKEVPIEETSSDDEMQDPPAAAASAAMQDPPVAAAASAVMQGPPAAAASAAMQDPPAAAAASAAMQDPPAAAAASAAMQGPPAAAAASAAMQGPPAAAASAAMQDPPAAAASAAMQDPPAAAASAAMQDPPAAAASAAVQDPPAAAASAAVQDPPPAAATSAAIQDPPAAAAKQRPPLAAAAAAKQRPSLAAAAAAKQRPPLAAAAAAKQRPPLAAAAAQQHPPLAAAAAAAQQRPPLAAAAAAAQQRPPLAAAAAAAKQRPPLAAAAAAKQHPSVVAAAAAAKQRPPPAAAVQDPPAAAASAAMQDPPASAMQDPTSSEECLLKPTLANTSSSQNPSDTSRTSLPGPSASEGHVIAKFFNSIRNMDVDEVADTLHKIAASNPAFSGMDVQNVIQILTESGTLKPKNTTSAS
ncbi:uncharacterized protein LOC128329291 isoform X2 [Hemicordylus capensis]|uniref:uncharacterized protein LOC128329291 isoform X2 n=1 Tax=Hemicordylus capensis TaxID=884348 RepID=UPI0023039583|nr:uncharacterized protein LOC128329291 isoform X2 [Hemicordylus capensis]